MKKVFYAVLIISVILGAAYGIKTAHQASEANKAAIAATHKAEAEAASKAEAEAKAKAEAEGNASNTGAGKTIVIDPGHASALTWKTEPIAPGSGVMKTMESGGATGAFTGTPEYLINMNVAKKLKPLLEAKGYRVVMTKTENSETLGNIARANIGNDQNAAMVIRIHCDFADGSSVNGASMLVPAKVNAGTAAIADISGQYGKTILDTLVSDVGMKNNGVVTRSDITGFNWTKVPVVLVEMGFLSNQAEDKLLSSDSYQSQLAAALARGIALAVK
ncbi:MAG TPA: N-acetylmuramoyl-L-alanine amidase [Clostridiaceae bacterium]